MSAAVICDECGRVVKRSCAIHCFDAVIRSGEMVYGADICRDCRPLFVAMYDGWLHLTYKKEDKEEAK